MFIIALIVSIVLSMATTAILYSVANARKDNQDKLWWSNGDTEVIYTEWHIFNHSGFLKDDIRKAEYLLSIKGSYALNNVIFEWKLRGGDSPFVRAKAIFKKKSDNDEIAEDKEVVDEV